jgi:hypothetical protein
MSIDCSSEARARLGCVAVRHGDQRNPAAAMSCSDRVCGVTDFVVEECILRGACTDRGMCPVATMGAEQFDELIETLSQPEFAADLERVARLPQRFRRNPEALKPWTEEFSGYDIRCPGCAARFTPWAWEGHDPGCTGESGERGGR